MPGRQAITLERNGAPRRAEVAAAAPLSWVPRDACGLTGTRLGRGATER